MRRLFAILVFGIGIGIGFGGNAGAQIPDLADLKAKLADSSIPIEEKVRRVLQAASSYDQAAQQGGSAVDRRLKWVMAIGILDDFVAANPKIEPADLIRFQAGVYRWAEGQSFADQFDQKPGVVANREGAIRAFDDAIQRLKAIQIKPDDASDVFNQNLRYRLAQAIADRVKLEPEGDPARTASEREALALLDASLITPGLRSFAALLRGQLCNRLDLYGQAQMEIQLAEKLDPPPSPESVLEAKVIALCGRTTFAEAVVAIDQSKLPEPFKDAMRIKVLIHRRRQKAPGRDRRELDDQALAIGERLRGTNRPEGRRALMDLARYIDEPSETAPIEAWDILAEGHLRLGNLARAGRLDGKAGDRSATSGSPEKAATLRYKAGAYLYEAGKFTEADERLSQVIDSKVASKDLKSRAGMLRSLARGRALATREAGASREAYVTSLETQVRDFPDDPSSGEARWLLGQIRQTAGKPDEALGLWAGIVHGHPRWLEARMTVGDRLQEAVESQRINRDSAAVNARMAVARKSLLKAIAEANDGVELISLKLQVARLELIPEVGNPSLAIEAADRVLKSAATPDQHQEARLDRLVALAQANRGVEAEKAAMLEAKTDHPARLFPALRRLDQSASEVESEINRKRFGLISQAMTAKIVDRLDLLSSTQQEEARLHHVRALLFAGNTEAARKEITTWGGFTTPPDDELLRELADTYLRLEAFNLAIDAERFRASRLSPGSPAWFDARYGMALAYYRAERSREARQIIDATGILHPDLGGGELRSKFERLRQKLGPD